MLTDCGRELYSLLADRGLSLREAARQAGCSPGYLSNVSHGRKSLTPRVAAHLDRVLGTGGTFAAFAVGPSPGIPVSVPDFRVPDVRVQPPAADISRGNAMAIIAALRGILPGYIQADRLVGSAALLLPLSSHIATVERACEVARGQDRSDVLAFASRFIEFCGWAHQDAGELGQAMQWTSKALDYAVELGDQRTIAYTLMRKASIATEAGMPGRGVGMASAALAHDHALTPRLRAVILRQRAQASAVLGESDAASRDADAAVDEAVAGASQGEDDLAPYCSPVYAAMEAGAVRLRLGKPREALAVLERSLPLWSDASQPRDHAMFLARRAQAYAAMGDRDQARAASEDALTAAAGLASRRVTGQLAGLASRLAVWDDDPGTAAIRTKLAAAGVRQGGPP
jgi:tetratricopeptide (TPR) repeat protein